MAKTQLTSAILNELLEYNPNSGELRWRERGAHWFKDSAKWSAAEHMRSFNNRYSGELAFTANDGDGYRIGRVLHQGIRAHRVIWAMVHDEWPEQIDHENGNRSDNRLSNLRAASPVINRQNTAMYTNNKSGVVGVRWSKWGWHAYIGNKPQIHLGYFPRLEDAAAARKVAEDRLGYHRNHGRSHSGALRFLLK
jgi:hypothetical protein